MANIKKSISRVALMALLALPVSCDLFEDDKEEDENEPQQPKTELYALYSFEGNASCTGQTTTTGVVEKGTYVTSFNGGRALELEATGRVTFPEAMIDRKNFTLACWVKDLFDGHVFHVESTEAYNTCLTLGVINGKLKFVQSNYNCNYQFADQTAYANNLLEGWHHIVISNDNGNSRLYVDGVYVDQRTENSIRCYGKGLKLIFGGALDTPDLNGALLTIDNLRIYRGTLSDNTVKKLYASEAPKGFTPGTGSNTSNVVNNALYAYFTFNGNASDLTRTALRPTLSGTTYVESYDGTGALKVPASGSLSIPDGMIDQKNSSITFWAKDLYDGHVFHAENGGSQSNINVLGMVDGNLKFVRSSYNCYYQFADLKSFTHPSLEGWHHIAIVASENHKLLYMDGQLCDQQTESTNGDYRNGIRFVFGNSLERPNLNANTLILDNLRVYKYRAITAEDVKAIYEFEKY